MQINLMKMAFPIGSTYITQADTNPSTILEFGTWERVKGKVLVGLDEDDADFNAIGKIGGEKTHTLTVDEMPSHTHMFWGVRKYQEGGPDAWVAEGTANYATEEVTTNSNGGNQPHNNLQPYKVVGYMWIRTA